MENKLTDLIRVHAVYQFFKKQEKKFERIDVTIGDKTTACPIAYIRVSELGKLEQMLKDAYQLGYEKAGMDRGRTMLNLLSDSQYKQGEDE